MKNFNITTMKDWIKNTSLKDWSIILLIAIIFVFVFSNLYTNKKMEIDMTGNTTATIATSTATTSTRGARAPVRSGRASGSPWSAR